MLVTGEASGFQQSRVMEGEDVTRGAIDQLRGSHSGGEVGATCKLWEEWLGIWTWDGEDKAFGRALRADMSPLKRFTGVKRPFRGQKDGSVVRSMGCLCSEFNFQCPHHAAHDHPQL